MSAVASQQSQQQPQVLVEEKYFPISLERSAGTIREAIEHAIGVELVELAHGMWTAEKPMARGQYQEITVRALPTDEGTTVEIRIEDRWRPGRAAITGTLFMVAAMFILPIFFIVARAQETARRLQRERLILMHRIWTEVTSTLGAPTRAGYRERPQRVRARAPDAEALEEEAVEEQLAPPAAVPSITAD